MRMQGCGRERQTNNNVAHHPFFFFETAQICFTVGKMQCYIAVVRPRSRRVSGR